MPKQTIPIANGFYEAESLPISAQQCINWYPNIVQSQALSQETLFGTPGLSQLITTGEFQEINRGAWVMAGIPYFVNGNTLYRLNKTIVDGVDTFSADDLGTIEGTARVSFADNGTQLCILNPGGKGYIFTDSPDSLVEITDGDFAANGQPQYVVYIDGYFLFTTDSKKFIVSALNDGTSYNALDFGSAEADPDDIVAPIVFKNQLFIGGSQSMEAFQNIGGVGFPFQRTGLFLDKGLSAAQSIVPTSDSFLFIGAGKNESPAIWSLAGSSAQKVSTTAIDFLLQQATDTEISEAFAWSYAQKGAYFVGFTFGDNTLVYDVVSQRWHERQSFIDGVDSRFRANSFVQAYGRIICGDSQDGRIGSLDPDVYTEYSNTIKRSIATQPFANQMDSFTVPQLELTVESGVGNGDVEEPLMSMDYSKNGGKTYVDKRTRKMGRIGEYNKRAIWRRLGRFDRFAVFRFTLSDAVKPVIIMCVADIL